MKRVREIILSQKEPSKEDLWIKKVIENKDWANNIGLFLFRNGMWVDIIAGSIITNLIPVKQRIENNSNLINTIYTVIGNEDIENTILYNIKNLQDTKADGAELYSYVTIVDAEATYQHIGDYITTEVFNPVANSVLELQNNVSQNEQNIISLNNTISDYLTNNNPIVQTWINNKFESIGAVLEFGGISDNMVDGHPNITNPQANHVYIYQPSSGNAQSFIYYNDGVLGNTWQELVGITDTQSIVNAIPLYFGSKNIIVSTDSAGNKIISIPNAIRTYSTFNSSSQFVNSPIYFTGYNNKKLFEILDYSSVQSLMVLGQYDIECSYNTAAYGGLTSWSFSDNFINYLSERLGIKTLPEALLNINNAIGDIGTQITAIESIAHEGNSLMVCRETLFNHNANSNIAEYDIDYNAFKIDAEKLAWCVDNNNKTINTRIKAFLNSKGYNCANNPYIYISSDNTYTILNDIKATSIQTGKTYRFIPEIKVHKMRKNSSIYHLYNICEVIPNNDGGGTTPANGENVPIQTRAMLYLDPVTIYKFNFKGDNITGLYISIYLKCYEV